MACRLSENSQLQNEAETHWLTDWFSIWIADVFASGGRMFLENGRISDCRKGKADDRKKDDKTNNAQRTRSSCNRSGTIALSLCKCLPHSNPVGQRVITDSMPGKYMASDCSNIRPFPVTGCGSPGTSCRHVCKTQHCSEAAKYTFLQSIPWHLDELNSFILFKNFWNCALNRFCKTDYLLINRVKADKYLNFVMCCETSHTMRPTVATWRRQTWGQDMSGTDWLQWSDKHLV